MLKQILSYLWGDDTKNLLLDEAIAAAEAPEDPVTPNDEIEKEQTNVCSTKVGVITKNKNGLHIIDDIYEYKSNEISFDVGTEVYYTIYMEDLKLKVSNVEVYKLWESEISVDNKTWCDRTTITQVYKRDGRLIYGKPENIVIDLNVTCTEFIPIEGDWLEVDLKSEINENVTNLFGKILEIKKIRPLRSKIINGIVGYFNEKTYSGNINNDIFFNRESLSDGYFPQKGDRVICEVIESNQGENSWRALNIIINDTNTRSLQILQSTDLQFINYEKDVDGINISNNIFIEAKNFNNAESFVIHIMNDKDENIELIDIKFDSPMSQVQLDSPKEFPLILMKNGGFVKIQFFVNAKTIGESKELILFMFKGFNVGRYIHINLNISRLPYRDRTVKNYTSNHIQSMRNFRNVSENQYIKGQRSHATPRFVGARIPEYKLPDRLWNIFLRYDNDTINSNARIYDDLIMVYSFLKESLSFQNYEQCFHILLFIDELESIMVMRKYDQDRACFIKNAEYLMLEIENLSECRPSIIIGDKIIAIHPNNRTINFEGFVHKVSSNHVYLKFAHMMHDSYNGEDYSIRVVQSRNTEKKFHHGIHLAVTRLGKDLLFPTKVFKKKPQIIFTYDKYENSIGQNQKSKRKSNKELMEIIKTYNSKKTSNSSSFEGDDSNVNSKQFKLEWYDKSLNYFQKEAVRYILVGESRPLPYVIFGPPGTGKTITVVESILQILRMLPHSRLLIATPSNSASDLIALRLINSGCLKPGDLVRFVSYKVATSNNIPPKLVPYCVSGSVAKPGTTDETVVTEKGLILGGGTEVIGRHRLTIGTCAALGVLHGMGFKKGHFTHIIVDEAGQCTEPEIMVPLTFLNENEGQIILAGDSKQLGPVIVSKQASDLGLSQSYLERLLSRFPYIRDVHGFPKTGGFDPRLVTCLIYNYRSLSEIIRISNDMFYHSELKSMIHETDSTEAKLLLTLKEIIPSNDNNVPCVVFHGVLGENMKSEDSPSWYNPDEASQVFYYMNQLYRLGLKSQDIGIIAPYIKQVKLIRAILGEAGFDVPKVGTVEEFQGQEFNVVILSTVRSNADYINSDISHSIGFISSPKRLNVALTRAKCLNIIIGNPLLLMRDTIWHKVIKNCVENGAYIGCDL